MYVHINRSVYEYVLEHLPQKKLSTVIMSWQSPTSTSRMKNCMKIAVSHPGNSHVLGFQLEYQDNGHELSNIC